MDNTARKIFRRKFESWGDLSSRSRVPMDVHRKSGGVRTTLGGRGSCISISKILYLYIIVQ